jgi:Type IV leader peptidase family
VRPKREFRLAFRLKNKQYLLQYALRTARASWAATDTANRSWFSMPRFWPPFAAYIAPPSLRSRFLPERGSELKVAMLKPVPEFVFPLAALLCAAVSSIYDVRSRRIPNFITLPAISLGLLLHGLLGGWKEFGTAAAAGLICGCIFLLFYLAGGMGAGDVKLITASGCLIGLSLIEPLRICPGRSSRSITTITFLPPDYRR